MNRYTIRSFKYGDTDCPMSKLQDLENKIEDGVLVELPCKVGDYVYRIAGENTTKPWVWHWEIVEIMIYQDEIVYRDDSDNIIENKDFGKTVFLTREEAEKALTERKEHTDGKAD